MGQDEEEGVEEVRGGVVKHFFTADLHLGHKNVIEYCNRPFKSLDHMNKELIRRWNERVKKEDFIYVLGDFCFRNSTDKNGNGVKIKAQEWIDQLNGNKIFIQGNHDRNNTLKTKLTSAIFTYNKRIYYLSHQEEDVPYCYAPNIALVGHVHHHWKIKRNSYNNVLVNVGVDVWNYYPVTIQEIEKFINTLKEEL